MKRNEQEATVQLREWLERNGYSVYTGNEFNVKNTAQKRPDMVIISSSTGSHSAIEIKTGRDKDIHKAYKIVNYASDYVNGAIYCIEGQDVEITNFLVATGESEHGKLFFDEIPNNYDKIKRQKIAYETWGHGQVEPYYEYYKSYAFVRNIWRGWTKREFMVQLKIGILLSSINDKDSALRQLKIPKIFVIRYRINSGKGKWGQQWTKL